MKNKLLWITVILLCPVSVISEQRATMAWLNVAPSTGITFSENQSGMGVLVSGNIRFSSHYWSFRYSAYEEAGFILRGDCFNNCISHHIREQAILFGADIVEDKLYFGGGISRVKRLYTIDGGPAREIYQVYGIPLELHWQINARNPISSGVTLFGNVNSKNAMAGLYFTFQFGYIK